MSTNALPNNFTINNIPLPVQNVPNIFACSFYNKVEINKNKLIVDKNTYNGTKTEKK
jgi:hypothetical protein